ncbi:MAG TPA: hypothetical protein VHT96_06770 [Clostridia bacterium]|nr:hypothetical protein [Clostridia bacterium]
MLITFWSNFHQTGTTSNTAALAVMTALEYRMKVLATHNQFDRSGLETVFLERRYVRNELMNYRDIGIDALSGFVRYNNVDRESISTFTTTLINSKLDLLVGTTITNRELYIKELGEVMENLIIALKNTYDLVFIDASGEDELRDKIVELSDLNVVSLTQDYNVLEHFFARYKQLPENCVCLLSRYDKDSRLNAKTIKRRYGLKYDIPVIPYSIEFSDACMEAKLIDFLMRNLNAGKDDLNYTLMCELRKTVKLLLERLNINTELKKLGD